MIISYNAKDIDNPVTRINMAWVRSIEELEKGIKENGIKR